MPYTLSMIVEKDGRVSEIRHTRETERECDEAQLDELPKLEAIGAKLKSATIIRERR